MGFFYSVRGWLELTDELLPQVLRLIAINEDNNPYIESWVTQASGSGWSRFMFFGHTVRHVSLEEVKRQIERIATTLKAVNDDDIDYVDGVFYVTPEDESQELIWICSQGKFLEHVNEKIQ